MCTPLGLLFAAPPSAQAMAERSFTEVTNHISSRFEALAGSVGVASGSCSPFSGTSSTAGGCDIDRRTDCRREADSELRLPETRRPSAPVREGPMIVVVYLSPVAPWKPGGRPGREEFPSSSLGAGLEGNASSGQRSMSASPASTTYGFERYDGSSEIRRGPYASSTFRRY